MTIPFICVFIVALLIYAPRLVVIAGQAKMPEGYDNKLPREQQARLPPWARRANAAHQNTLEAFAPFAAAVVIAHLAGADRAWSAYLAISFVVARVVYPALYIANLDKLRSTVWGLGLSCVVGLFALPWL